MKLLLELSMECESLARAEAVSAAAALGGNPKVLCSEPGVLVLATTASPESLLRRVALCHKVSEWLGTTDLRGLDSLVEGADVRGPIRVRSTRVGEAHREVDLAAMTRRAGGLLGKVRGVDLHSPASEVRIVFSEAVHVGRLVGSVDRTSFEARMNKRLPFHCPVSLHPKFARALVNLTRVPDGGTVLDPFCGTGAILAETHLAGLKAVGTDISEKMLQGARANLGHLGAVAVTRVCDVGSIGGAVGEVDGIATDPPYGRATSTNGEPLEELYARSFRSFADVLGRGCRLAIAVPDPEVLASASGFKELERHPLWVHRSLTRNFCVLERV
ncbi:MAG: DNA methyltransferase [Thermoplasmata archaeon]